MQCENSESTSAVKEPSVSSETSANPQNNSKAQFCNFFFKNGWCKLGEKCKFSHDQGSFTNNFSRECDMVYSRYDKRNRQCENYQAFHFNQPISYTRGGYRSRLPTSVFQRKQGVSSHSRCNEVNRGQFYHTPICYYFKKGFCRNGTNCKFYHPLVQSPHKDLCKDKCNVVSESQNEVLKQNDIVSETCVARAENNITNSTLYTVSQRKTLPNKRETEIAQLKKRFPTHKVFDENTITTFVVTFCPTDPDWPFDVRSIELEAFFPEDYPQQMCRISVLKTSEDFPDLLIRFLNVSIKEWLQKRYDNSIGLQKTELVFRPFLRWFDKNLEQLFVLGLRKVKQDIKAAEAGIEFIPVEKLFISHESKSKQSDENMPENALESQSKLSLEAIDCNEKEAESHNCNLNENSSTSRQPVQNILTTALSVNKTASGTKMVLSDLEMTDSAAAMVCIKLSCSLQCGRCKTRCSVVMSNRKQTGAQCAKCHRTMMLAFEASTIHPFSSVLGYLSIVDCQAVDVNMVECEFLVDCLNCLKQISMNGIHYGQKHTTWCIFCNKKLVILIGGIKFVASEVSCGAEKFTVLPVKREKKSKGPVIHEGEPLPDFGTCKHYKKSYRWLRFPCCGKIFPCDVCHNEKEMSHEMKFASRMICGFCAKEQPYTKDKPCSACSSSMTKRAGGHWEGGKGCRNKTLMNREDKQKYSGVNKTVSKKAQGIKTAKK